MSYETIRLGEATNFIEIRCLEYGEEPGMSAGDLRLGISVLDSGFAGAYDEVWVGRDDWAQFIVSLEQFERERDGQATLTSMSPGEFELNLRVLGHRGGRVNADGYLSRYRFGMPAGTMQSRVYYSIAIDPSMLRMLVDSFVELGQRDA